MTLQRIVTVPGLLTALAFAVHGAPVPPPEQLLPADTLLVLAVPDCGKSRAEWRQSPASQLWNDPSMKAFTEKLWTKVKTDLIEPFEKSAGIKLADYSALAQGQVTFAVTQNGWDGVGEARPGLLLLVDAGSKADTLKTNLAMLRKKWVDSGKPLKTEKIREVEFTVLVASPDDLGKALGAALGSDTGTAKAPGGAEPADKSAGKLEWIVGQSDSLLIAGNSIKDIEKVLVRQSGGSVAHLAETASFAASFNAQLRGASAYVWVNAKPLIETVVKQLARGTGDDAGQPRGPLPGPDRIFAALGLTGLQTVAASVRDTAEGCHIEGRLTVPESARRGLFKLVAFEAKEAEPPPFVPVDAVKFNRWRLDLPKAFATLEAMIVEMSPQAAGVIKLLLDNAGKDKDPNFDLRKSLIGNLGDDVISYEKAPREQTLEAMGSQPNLILIASPRAQELAASIQALASFMPQRGTKNKEREFLGRKVYALGLPPAPVPGGGPPVERTLHYTASGGYVALSLDAAMLEEYLRSSGGDIKPLRAQPGLAEAAQKVGGMGTGLFAYENQAESIRVVWNLIKQNPSVLTRMLGGTPIPGRDNVERIKEWADFSLLPEFDKVAKYFHFNVVSGAATAEGLQFKMFAPTPPQLRK